MKNKQNMLFNGIKFLIADEIKNDKCGVHFIKMSKFFNRIKIKIWLERPGLFIGYHGRKIDDIQAKIEDNFKLKVKFVLKDYEPLPIDLNSNLIIPLASDLLDALTEKKYGQHDESCIACQWREGRPTADGGYESLFGYGKNAKWYKRNEYPECTCGFAKALAEYKEDK